MKHKIVVRLSFLALCLPLLLGLIATHIPFQAPAASIGASSPITCGQWNLLPVTSKDSTLWAVTGTALNDAWAVGWMNDASNPGVSATLTMH